MVPLSTTHDPSVWHKNTLYPFPDNKKLQMKFDDFSHTGVWEDLDDMWAFACTQLIHSVIPDIIHGTTKTKKRILRELYNSQEFIKFQDAVVSHLATLGIECNGVELDEEEIVDYNNPEEGNYRVLRPYCNIDHESCFGIDGMLKASGCTSIPELIWGLKKIDISWS
jgi:hypothetical protein